MKKLVILGAGGFAREVLWLVEDINKQEKLWDVLGFIDENEINHHKIIDGIPVLGGIEWFEKYDTSTKVYAVCAIGNNNSKKEIINKVSASRKNIVFPTLIHPTVIKSNKVEISEGVVVCAGNYLTTSIQIGKHVIINLNCTIGHDAIIDDFVTIFPGVNLSGNVHVHTGSSLGTGTAIIQGISIGSWSIIGAGAVVVKDIPANCTAVGSPAKPIKYNI